LASVDLGDDREVGGQVGELDSITDLSDQLPEEFVSKGGRNRLDGAKVDQDMVPGADLRFDLATKMLCEASARENRSVAVSQLHEVGGDRV
jgi:hypothetical protein